MRRSRVGSSFTATRDEYIKLEFKRRANHPGLRRRSSITDQFAVRAPTSRLKERLAQARHHEFILQTENRAALDSIVDRVRELSDYHTGVAQSLSPMERNKLLAWANDVEKIMYEFEPSDDHHMDPFVAVLEKLQFLQDGHICLVEVAVEGRRLLERWERSGVFDSDSSGSSGSDDEDRIDDRRTPYERNTERLIEQSFGYMSIRARAAARVIKRNIVRWARAKENFRERVEELQLFGSTTQTLMKQLTGGSPSARRAGNDVFDLVKVRREAMLSQTILFKDLMQFSKHVALYPIDQALRCVEELELKRFLFETRCAMKLQMFWRKVQKELPVRRMMKLIDTVKRRDRKSSDVSVAGTPKTRRSSNKRDSASLASDIPPSPIMPLPTTLETPASAKARTPADSRETDSRGAIAPGLVTRQKAEQQVRKSRGSRYPSGASGATKAATPQSSQTAVPVPTPPSSGSRSFKGRTPNALLPVETEIRRDSATSDDDTRDVEAAWKTFLETAATVAETEAAEAARKGSDPGLHAIDEEASPTAVVSSTAEAAAGETLDQDSGDWLTWSDDEKVEGGSDSDEERNDDGNRHLLSPHVKFPKHHQSRRSSYTPPSAGGFAMNAPMTPMRVIVNVRAGQRQTDDTSNSAADGSAFDPRNALSSRELREILNSIEAHAQQSLTDAAAAPKTPPTAPRQGTASTTASATMSNSAVTTPERTSRLRAQPSRQSFVLPFDEVKRPEQTSVPTTPSDMGKTPRRPLHELSSTEVDSGFHLLELLDPLVVASSLALLEEPPMTVKPTRPAVLVDPTRVKVTTLRADQLRQRINESRKRQDDTAAAKSSHVRQSAASAALAANYKAQPLVYAIPSK
ncbi:TPA: hypothetical protein N0F65_009015 [Lagenidium giganteum]|uniref:Uncharacterized protein n=1 Tax=Lagenidium giganteum TaxID=4803 RepID=A0AAV2YUP1_9STRA|nr:TPA: hypothetical protein N0F65_009015 [Lagenidium giganteum]